MAVKSRCRGARAFGALGVCAWCGGLDDAEQVSRDVALEAAFDLVGCLAFGGATGGLVACGGVGLQARQHDRVEGAVELTIAATVEAVTWNARSGTWRRHGRIGSPRRLVA